MLKNISFKFPIEEDIELFRQSFIKTIGEKKFQKILLINPPDGDIEMFNLETAKLKRYPNYPPYGLGIISNQLLKRGYDVEILNLNDHLLTQANEVEKFDYNKIVFEHLNERIKKFSPDLIGLTCMFTMTHKSLKNVVDHIYKEFKIPMAVGGVHITNSIQSEITKEQFINDLKNVNYFFLFESEIAFADFINTINNSKGNIEFLRQIVFRDIDGKLFEIDDRVVPSGEDLDISPNHSMMPANNFGKYGKIGSFAYLKKPDAKFSTVLSNRGCRASCTFCSVRNFNGKKVRSRSVQSVIDELLYLRHEQDVDHIMFLDDDLLYDRKRAIELFTQMDKQDVNITWDASNGIICSAITEEVIEAAYKGGCIGVYLGMESGNPQILKQIRKPGTVKNFLNAAEILKKYPHINTRVLLMIGFPNETFSNIYDTVKVSLEMDLDWYQVSPLQPLPNTPIFDQMSSDGLLSEQKTSEVKYIGGSYGGNRKAAEKDKNAEALLGNFMNVFSSNLNDVPSKDQIRDVWSYMNYTLNYERLKKIENPIKIEQAQKYLEYIANIVAPNDPIVWYYLDHLETKLKKDNSKSKQKVLNIIKDNPNWKSKLSELNLI